MGEVIHLFERINRGNVITVPGPGIYGFDIVGESNYQDALEAIAGGRKQRPANLKVEAVLKYESDNPYDPKAVRVEIDGETVGYLNRKNARHYRDQMSELGYEGYTVKCPAKIVGGWFIDEDNQGHFGVRLDLPTATSKNT